MYIYIQCTNMYTYPIWFDNVRQTVCRPNKYPLLYFTHNHRNTARHTHTQTETYSALGRTLHRPPTFFYRYTCDILRTQSPTKLVTILTTHTHKLLCISVCQATVRSHVQSLLLLLVAAVSLHSIASL